MGGWMVGWVDGWGQVNIKDHLSPAKLELGLSLAKKLLQHDGLISYAESPINKVKPPTLI